jgi:alpha-D-xyloside xylohydrolase
MKTLLKYLLLAALMTANVQLFAQAADPAARDALAPSQPPKVEKVADGVIVPLQGAFLKVEFCAPDIVRVVCAPNRAFFDRKSVTTEPKQIVKTSVSVKTANGESILSTSKLQVHVNLASGAVSFFDAGGKSILAEKADGRAIVPSEVQGEQTFHVSQQWQPNADESLYGLGQRQIGIVDIKGYDLDLWQHNTHVVVPFLVSSRGYGIFGTIFRSRASVICGSLRTFPANCLLTRTSKSGGLTTGTFTHGQSRLAGQRARHQHHRPPAPQPWRRQWWRRWLDALGRRTCPDDHRRLSIKTYSNGHIKMWLDGKVVIDHWRQSWLTDNDQIKVPSSKPVIITPSNSNPAATSATTMELTWKTPAPDESAALWSEVGDGVDYYFVHGPALDKVVAVPSVDGAGFVDAAVGVRAMAVAAEVQHRAGKPRRGEAIPRPQAIPFDNIVQDWQYWKADAWGSHQFDPARFPDPAGWIRSVHDLHAHVMISVWGKFYPGTANFDAMQKAGFLIPA